MQAGCRLADGYRGSVHEPPITRLGGFLISRRGDTDHLHDPGSRPGERTHFEICEQLSVEPQRGKDVLNLCRHDDCSPWTCDPKQAMGSDRPKIGAHIGMYRSLQALTGNPRTERAINRASVIPEARQSALSLLA